jgi:Tol biopolymer transport system component
VGPAAEATFPGRNGEIVFLDMVGVYSDSETVTELIRVCPDGLPEWDFLPRTWDTGVTYSPDGRTVATHGISLAAVTGRWERQLTRPPRRASDVGPVWSPKGGALAFTRERYRGRYSVRSRAVRIYQNGSGRFVTRGFMPAWSSRDQIAFVRGQYDDSSTHKLYIASLRSGAIRRLTSGSAPRWSPDGRRLVFTRATQDATAGTTVREIATISANGTGLRRLASGEAPSWSPNVHWIGFHDPAGYAAVISPTGRGLRRLARSPRAPLFSPDSRWAAYPSRYSEELYLVPVKGGGRRWVTSSSEELELLDWRAAPASETRC